MYNACILVQVNMHINEQDIYRILLTLDEFLSLSKLNTSSNEKKNLTDEGTIFALFFTSSQTSMI